MRLVAVAIALAASAVSLSGCLEVGDAPGGIGDGPIHEPIRSLGKGAPTHGEDGRREHVVTDAATWRALWDELHEGCGDACPALPVVDFTRERVLVAQWSAPDPCHGAEIVMATTHDGETLVVARMVKPPETVSCIAVLAYPWAAVAIPARDTPVEWTWHTALGEPAADAPDRDPPAPEGEPGDPMPPVSLREVARGQHSAMDVPEHVIDSEAEWDAFWTRHGAKQDPPPERPVVDFTRERVLAVFWPDRTSGGHVITIAEVLREGDGLVANVIREQPKGGGAITVMTQPYHMVAIPSGNEAVAFRYSDA